MPVLPPTLRTSSQDVSEHDDFPPLISYRSALLREEPEQRIRRERSLSNRPVERVVIDMVESWLEAMNADLRGKGTRGGALRLPGLDATSVERDDGSYFLHEARSSYQEPDSAHMTRPGQFLEDQEEFTLSRFGRRTISYRVALLVTLGPVNPQSRASLEIDIGPLHWQLEMGPDEEYQASPRLIASVKKFRDRLAEYFDRQIDSTNR